MAWTTDQIHGFDFFTGSPVTIGKAHSFFAGVSSGSLATDATIYRNSGRSLKLYGGSGINTGSAVYFDHNKGPSVCYGFGFYLSSDPVGSNTDFDNTILFQVTLDNSEIKSHFCICVPSDKRVYAVKGAQSTHKTFTSATPTILGASDSGLAAVPVTTWAYMEVQAYIHASAGKLKVKINGVVYLDLSGIDTTYDGTTTTAKLVGFQNTPRSGSMYVDDFYLRSDSAEYTTDGFLGELSIKPDYPIADGTYAQMTPSTGSSHYQLVDEATPNNTDYVSSGTALQKDSFTYQTTTGSVSIKAVQLSAYMFKTDSGFRGADLFVKSGATEDFTAYNPLSISEKYVSKTWDVDPATGVEWTQSGRNAAEFGVRVSSDL
jgi:hypothetical protein